jgi:hypothetical protein
MRYITAVRDIPQPAAPHLFQGRRVYPELFPLSSIILKTRQTGVWLEIFYNSIFTRDNIVIFTVRAAPNTAVRFSLSI